MKVAVNCKALRFFHNMRKRSGFLEIFSFYSSFFLIR
nr:MAG TPA: hypothetical protein [Caudoviricetes sp.]